METKQKIFILGICRNFALIVAIFGILIGVMIFVKRLHGLRFSHGLHYSAAVTSLAIGLGAYFLRRFCVRKLAQYQKENPTAIEAASQITRASWFVTGGFFLGAVVGFLLRPSVPLAGQLPFLTVLTRGAKLQGLDQIFIPAAQQSFNYMLVGAIIGGVVGFVIPKFLDKSKPKN